MSAQPGHWEGWAAPSTVDWCEPNYVVTSWVAEFWNTTSSAWLAVLGLVGIWALAPRARFRWLFGMFALVGVGSMAFHGTLLRPAQALDELPMVFFSLICVWAVAYRGLAWVDGRTAASALGLFAALFTAAYAVLPFAFTFFTLVYGALVTWLFLTGMRMSWAAPDPAIRWLLPIASLCFLGTFFGCWVPEHLVLDCAHPMQALQLHSFWHMGAGTGTFLFIVWIVRVDGAARHGRSASDPV